MINGDIDAETNMLDGMRRGKKKKKVKKSKATSTMNVTPPDFEKVLQGKNSPAKRRLEAQSSRDITNAVAFNINEQVIYEDREEHKTNSSKSSKDVRKK